MAPTRLYNEVVAAVYEVCAAATLCEEAGWGREDIVGMLAEVRRIHARSPFIDRLQRWPRGYPGDFETVEYICGAANQSSPETIEYHCEAFALSRPIAQQHRNKVHLQARRIEETMRAYPGRSRVFAIAAGSCPDFRSIPNLTAIAGDIWLNDSAEDALAFAMNELSGVRDRITVVPGNALRVARRLRQKFDLVLAGGLFDYLPDDAAVYLLRTVVSRLLYCGGAFFFTNIASGNPYRPLIEYLGDWFLIERSEDDLARLCEEAGIRREHIAISRDTTGLALIVEVNA